MFHKMVGIQFDAKILILRIDNGGEYMDDKFQNYLAENGAINQTTCVDTPTQNGVAERKNRHLLEIACALMFSMGIPKSYWGDAVLTAAYLINRMPSSVLDYKSLLELLIGTTATHLIPPKVFGCVYFVNDHKKCREKLDPKALNVFSLFIQLQCNGTNVITLQQGRYS